MSTNKGSTMEIEDPTKDVVKAEASFTKSSDDLEIAASDNESEELETQSPRTKPFIVLVACCAALGGLIFGYDIAGAGATFVMDGFQEHFDWECSEGEADCTPATEGEKDFDKGFINGLFGAGATIGALLNPYFAEKYGRRPCLALSTCVFIFGASIQTAAPEMWVMFLGRIFSGMGIGMLSMCVPIYNAECAPEHTRGQLGTLWQVAITCGILIASAANLGLKNWSEGWRLSYGGNILFAILLLLCLIFMPESPRWLANHGTEEQLYASLKRLRYEDEIEHEVKKLRQEVEEEEALGSASWGELLSTENNMRARLLLGMSLQAFQQLCGINAIMFYAPDILDTFFSEDKAIAGTFALNTVNFLSTFITIATVERFGRVKLMVLGGLMMVVALVANAIFSSLPQTVEVGYCVIAFASLYIVGFAISWGPVVWIVCSEIFPLRTRGKATGLTSMTNWACTTLVGALFPYASSASLTGCFAFFAVIISGGILTVYFLLPEVKGLTILQIDRAFANHKPALKRKTW